MRYQIANAIGDCTGDSFIVSGTNNNIPMICGENSGQHSKYKIDATYLQIISSSCKKMILFPLPNIELMNLTQFTYFSIFGYGRGMRESTL